MNTIVKKSIPSILTIIIITFFLFVIPFDRNSRFWVLFIVSILQMVFGLVGILVGSSERYGSKITAYSAVGPYIVYIVVTVALTFLFIAVNAISSIIICLSDVLVCAVYAAAIYYLCVARKAEVDTTQNVNQLMQGKRDILAELKSLLAEADDNNLVDEVKSAIKKADLLGPARTEEAITAEKDIVCKVKEATAYVEKKNYAKALTTMNIVNKELNKLSM